MDKLFVVTLNKIIIPGHSWTPHSSPFERRQYLIFTIEYICYKWIKTFVDLPEIWHATQWNVSWSPRYILLDKFVLTYLNQTIMPPDYYAPVGSPFGDRQYLISFHKVLDNWQQILVHLFQNWRQTQTQVICNPVHNCWTNYL